MNTSWWYCWWTKSCTTNHDDYPIIYRVLTIPVIFFRRLLAGLFKKTWKAIGRVPIVESDPISFCSQATKLENCLGETLEPLTRKTSSWSGWNMRSKTIDQCKCPSWDLQQNHAWIGTHKVAQYIQVLALYFMSTKNHPITQCVCSREQEIHGVSLVCDYCSIRMCCE